MAFDSWNDCVSEYKIGSADLLHIERDRAFDL